MPNFRHNGCRIHYEDTGHGTPVVLVHGLGSSTRDWEYQIPTLSQYHRVIAVDVRGHGLSDKPRQRYRMTDFAGDVMALIDHLNLGPVHLVGLSMGGMIGFQLGVDAPRYLRSLTVVNSSPHVRPSSLREYLEVARRWILSRLLSMQRIGQALGPLLFPYPEQARLREKMAERWGQNDKRAYLASLDAIIGWSVQNRLTCISCPILVITADRDYTPVEHKRTYAAQLPDARVVVIEHSRHATPLDQPERFNTCLLEFLKQVDQSPNEDTAPHA